MRGSPVGRLMSCINLRLRSDGNITTPLFEACLTIDATVLVNLVTLAMVLSETAALTRLVLTCWMIVATLVTLEFDALNSYIWCLMTFRRLTLVAAFVETFVNVPMTVLLVVVLMVRVISVGMGITYARHAQFDLSGLSLAPRHWMLIFVCVVVGLTILVRRVSWLLSRLAVATEIFLMLSMIECTARTSFTGFVVLTTVIPLLVCSLAEVGTYEQFVVVLELAAL